MSFESFMRDVESQSARNLSSIKDEHHFSLGDGFDKQASDHSKEEKERLAQSKYGLDSREYTMATKIAMELEEISHSARFRPSSDSDYKFLMKKAGVAVAESPAPEIGLIAQNTLEKVANGRKLNPIEELYTLSSTFQKLAFDKEAGIGDWVIRQGLKLGGKPVTKVKKPTFGSLGSYAVAATPFIAGASYLGGRSSGAKSKEQDIANQIAEKLRYESSKQQAEEQGI